MSFDELSRQASDGAEAAGRPREFRRSSSKPSAMCTSSRRYRPAVVVTLALLLALTVSTGCSSKTETTCRANPLTGALTCTETKSNNASDWLKDYWYIAALGGVMAAAAISEWWQKQQKGGG